MADIQSAAAEISREKKEERKKKNKPQHENIMVCPISYGDHNNNWSKSFSERPHSREGFL